MDMFESIAKNLEDIKNKLDVLENKRKYRVNDRKVELCAVTKTVDVDMINFAISCGVKIIGENRAAELLQKYDKLNKENLKIHFIGNLQTNKVKSIIDKVDMIESVNSLRLCEEINKRAGDAGKVMDILFEVNIGGEKTKTGAAVNQTEKIIRDIAALKNIKLRGLMTILPICSEKSELEKYFTEIYAIFIDIASKKIDNTVMEFLSMGMSGDYETAVGYGSNLIRLGRAVFGERIQ